MTSILADIAICLRFFSRLPLPATRREAELGAQGFAAAAPLVPLAGALIGCFPALTLVATRVVGLPCPVAASLAVAVLLAVTGALHEDGLADCADGFGGGRTRERKLEIMRDSRIGTFGACALVLSLALRVSSYALLAADSLAIAAVVVVASAGASRALCLLPLLLLPSARADGLGVRAAADLPKRGVGVALALAASLAFLPVAAGVGLLQAITAVVAAGCAAGGVVLTARRQIGGQTGDVAGAAQQVSEIAVLVAFTAGL